MKSLFKASLIVASLTTTAVAQERILTPEKAKGFDGVITQCIRFARVSYVDGMCDALDTSVARLAKDNGLHHINLGQNEWGFGTDEYLRAPDTFPAKQPIHLTYYIRASDAPAGTFVWLSLYQDAGQKGRFVLWEDSGLGVGDIGTITAGLTQGLEQKLSPVFKALGQGRAK